ncbi:MAG: hypothetical protein KI790_19495 [Cyclobacteriaceae bacterium]|nr:hypothetical protein [Cyclobacteriaceae bacterium HetDA_MAG_MS6]
MDHKAAPRYSDGIKFLLMSDIPTEQVGMFSSWVSTDSFIQIPNNQEVAESRELIEYEVYDYWFQNHFLVDQDMDYFI